MKLNVTKNFDLRNINLDLSRELNVGIDYIAADIEEGIDSGGNFGKPFVRNAPSTVKKKGFDKPLQETGSMKDADKMIKTKATSNKQVASLRPNSRNIDKVEWNNYGTETIPARKFWGISKDAEKKVLTFISQKIDRELKNA